MPKLTFKIDKEKDIRNAWELYTLENSLLENEEKKQVESVYKKLWGGRSFEECKGEIEQQLGILYSSGIVDAFKEGIEKAWGKIHGEYFTKLERITKKPICSDEFTAYITTVGRCPYNVKDSSFMVSIRRPLLQGLRTIGHELIHLQFYNTYWKEIAEQIGEKKTDDLNESLTALLNLEFGNLWLVRDEGYPAHKELREFIVKEWEKEKDFETLLRKCVAYLKK